VARYTNINQNNGYCVLGVYRSKESSGNVQSDFTNEWQAIVVGPFKVTAAPKKEAVQEEDGWKVLLGTANFQDAGGGTSAVLLTAISGFGRVLSILVILNDQSYMPVVERFLDTVRLTKPIAQGNAQPNQPRNSGASENKIAGVWSKKSSSPWGTAPGSVVTNNGYYTIQYQFKADGSYTFKGESWGGYLRSEEWWTIEETGAYSVNGNSLTIAPRTSKATLRNREGAVKRSQNNPLEAITYRWALHYFEGLNETQLVLQPAQQTARDGRFEGNSNFPNAYLFSPKADIPNAYLFSPKADIEWRF
jgi:hypothetical protein